MNSQQDEKAQEKCLYFNFEKKVWQSYLTFKNLICALKKQK